MSGPADIRAAIEAAMYRAARDYPLLGGALAALEPVYLQPGALRGAPAAVDRFWRLYVDPEGWASRVASPEEGEAVVLHELAHLLEEHHERWERVGCSAEVFNVAADAAINWRLRQEGHKLPARAIYPESIGQPGGLIVEEYVSALLQQGQQQQGQQQQSSSPNGSADGAGAGGGAGSGQQQGGGSSGGSAGSGSGSGQQSAGSGSTTGAAGGGAAGGQQQPSAGAGGVPSAGGGRRVPGAGAGRLPSPDPHGSGAAGAGEWELPAPDRGGPRGVTKAHAEAIRRAVAQSVASAPKLGRGTAPAFLERWARQLLRPKVDWRRELRALIASAITRSGASDTTYMRISRRQAAVEARLAAGIEREIAVGVIIDTSGSISDSQLDRAVTETVAIARSAGADVVAVGCDTAATRAVRVRRVDDLKPALTGGGGSDMRPAQRELARLQDELAAVVYIGDGDASFEPRPLCRAAHIAVLTTTGELQSLPAYWRRLHVTEDPT